MTKGEQTRQKIVEAAAPIFNRRGYEGSSINDLMAATGLKKGGIYRHFSSKEELAAEAFDYTWEQAWNARMVQVDETAPGLEQLRQLISAFVDRRGCVAGGCPVLNTAVDADDGNSVLRAKVAKALKTWRAKISSMVKLAADHGEIKAGTDPKAVATLIIATLEGALMISRVERCDDALKRVEAHLNQYLDTLLAAD
ncbi:MAG TPA: TetR/AcrR family transcriptional regulator [Bryobacteraceae bacterium]